MIKSFTRTLLSKSLAGGLVLALALGGRLQAVEPLPPQIQRAPLAVQRAYLEKRAQEALQEKLEVGRQRFAQRLQYKQSLIRVMRHEAEVRNAIVRRRDLSWQSQLDQSNLTSQFGYYWMDWLTVLAVLVGGGVLLRLRFVAPPKLGPKRIWGNAAPGGSQE